MPRTAWVLLVTLLTAGFASSSAQSKPAPVAVRHSGFGLFARASLRWVGNRVHCFVTGNGWLCGAESSVLGGAYWPAGTGNQYIFNSGLQFAGIIDPASAGNSWAGDTTGGFFFNARGGTNGQQLTSIYDGANLEDFAGWPAEAYVPSGTDRAAAFYHPSLQGRKTASDRDIWFLSWEGDPTPASGRRHPLGVMVETRGLAFKSEAGQDLLFFLFTFYNVTAANPAVYHDAPLRLQPRLRETGARFHALNAVQDTVLPADGYIIRDLYLSIGTDFDVTASEAGANYSSVNVPAGLGYSYHHTFASPPEWSFAETSIYARPFFPGAGFVGVKFLKTPAVNGQPAGLTLFSTTSGGGGLSPPRSVEALYRYLIGHPDASAGDGQCNTGDPAVTHICYQIPGAPNDTRFFQVTGPLTLAPGDYQTVAVAYVFAAPVATGSCTGTSACGSVRPAAPTGDLTRFTDPVALESGANTVDSIAGFRGWRDTAFTRRLPTGDSLVLPNGVIDQEELTVIPGSLLGKARTAQAIFDSRFLLPMPPAEPEFLLIPGDDQVTVVWRASATERDGDPWYPLSQAPETFDPNYRQYDVAGYRIYRGTTADPANLRLLAQFDFRGDVWNDRTGQINQLTGDGYSRCAPFLGVFTGCTSAGTVHGVPTVAPIPVSLDGPITQWETIVASGAGIYTVITVDTTVSPPDTTIAYVPVNLRAFASKVDTALTGGGTPRPALEGTGIPFTFVDRMGGCNECGVRNHRRYFYVVSAFDLNSVRSGPSSLESSLAATKSVVPTPPPVNVSSSGTIQPIEVLGRRGPLADSVLPTLDPVTGRFSKPFPPANGAWLALPSFLTEVLSDSGAVTLRLDSLMLGRTPNPGLAQLPITYYWSATRAGSTQQLTTLGSQSQFEFDDTTSTAYDDAIALDSAAAARFGGSNQFTLPGMLRQVLPGSYYTSSYGRGCLNGAPGFDYSPPQAGCDFNGARWFVGPSPQTNETRSHPVFGNAQNVTFGPVLVNRSLPNNGGWNNGGELTGVEVIHQPYSYQTMRGQWGSIEAIVGGAKRAADYNVYWNATTAGRIDSVIDVTHDVVVPFDSVRVGGSWGILNQQAAQPSGIGVGFDQRPELTLTDFGCVGPFRSLPGGNLAVPCNTAGVLGDGPVYLLDSIARIGPIAHFDSAPAMARTSPYTGQGFALYLAGNLFMLQTTTPPQGVIWSLRDYVGAITGGTGFGGTDGPYVFYPVVRPFAAVGASLRLRFTTRNITANARDRDLRRVHTVPDPYYETLGAPTSDRVVRFVNLPERAIIRTYTVSGILVTVIEHNTLISSEAVWDLRNRNGRKVGSGVYFWHVEALNARRVGRMTIVTGVNR